MCACIVVVMYVCFEGSCVYGYVVYVFTSRCMCRKRCRDYVRDNRCREDVTWTYKVEQVRTRREMAYGSNVSMQRERR